MAPILQFIFRIQMIGNAPGGCPSNCVGMIWRLGLSIPAHTPGMSSQGANFTSFRAFDPFRPRSINESSQWVFAGLGRASLAVADGFNKSDCVASVLCLRWRLLVTLVVAAIGGVVAVMLWCGDVCCVLLADVADVGPARSPVASARPCQCLSSGVCLLQQVHVLRVLSRVSLQMIIYLDAVEAPTHDV
jgi:hypothetical protein